MKTAARILLCVNLAICPLTAPVMAETVRIPVGDQSAGVMIDKPLLGMSKAMVEKHFGTARERMAPRGQPPISRWVYDNFVVYFEFDTVIHSVTRHQPQGNP